MKMQLIFLMFLGYKIESGEMQIIREKNKETILFYGGVVITDTNAVITSPSATYLSKDGVMELSGPVSGFYQTRNLKCDYAKIYEKERIFKGYRRCDIQGPAETLRCDSIILHGDSLLAFGDVYLKSEKDSVEAEGNEVLIRDKFLRVRGNALLKSTSSDSLALKSFFYVYRDSILSASGNVIVNSKDFEASGDSLYYDRRERFFSLYGNALVRDQKNTVTGPQVIVFLNTENKIDSALSFPGGSLKNAENGKEIFIEGDTLKFYSEGTDSLKWFKGYKIKGYYKEEE
ncbi:MAG: LptA/OstA family protein [Candidatus Hydrothermia bacterium]